MWDFEWDEWSDSQVQEFSHNSGIAGALIFVPATMLFVLGGDDPALWLFGGMLCVHSAGQGALGFQRDVGWRRIYAMIGVSIGFLCIWEDIDSGIMKGLMLILAALTLFMLGILYMTRAGFEMKGTGTEADLQIPELYQPEIEEWVLAERVNVDIPEPIKEDDSEHDDDGDDNIDDGEDGDDDIDATLNAIVEEITERHEQMFGNKEEVEQEKFAFIGNHSHSHEYLIDFSFDDFKGVEKIKYENVPNLCDKFNVKKNLINPIYIS